MAPGLLHTHPPPPRHRESQRPQHGAGGCSATMPRTLTGRSRGLKTQTRQTQTQLRRPAELRAARRMRSGDGTPRALGGGARRRPSPREAGPGAERGGSRSRSRGRGERGAVLGAGVRDWRPGPGAGAGRGLGQGQGEGPGWGQGHSLGGAGYSPGYVRGKAPGEKGDCDQGSAGTVGLLEGSRSRLGRVNGLEARPRVAGPRLRAEGPQKVFGLCGRESWRCGSLRAYQGLALAVPHAWKALPCP